MKNKILLSLIISVCIFYSNTYAEIKITPSEIKTKQSENEIHLNQENVFVFLANRVDENIPESYKYINLKFKWVIEWSEMENALKKLVYLNLIENSNTKLSPEKQVDKNFIYKLSKKILDINLEKEDLIKEKATFKDIQIIKNRAEREDNIFKTSWDKEIRTKKSIFFDVYNTLKYWHYDKEKIDEVELLDSAINWLTKWVWDKHTSYFPATESKNFYENLNWEFEWIWAYVDMQEPWVLKIISPLKSSPAEEAGLKWWDIVTKVNWVEVTKQNSLLEVISWIKWPAWTSVMLTIDRKWKIYDIEVKRAKIVINDIEYRLITKDTVYIEIKSFWENVSKQFAEALMYTKERKNTKKIIIDLRNNWWWYLDQVADMLSYLVDKWEPTAIVEYLWKDKNYYSKWYSLINPNDYKIVLLQNSGTASASEIMIWTIKDYFPNSVIIWEKSFWKWSVQTLRTYSDTSFLKYTVAKWFTWKTKKWIDWVWITPDKEIIFDLENFRSKWYDNQLEEALNTK